jgi:hypothetical protein
MRACEYRQLVRNIVKNVLNKRFPGLNKAAKKEAADLIAKMVHCRFYGARVDEVVSPLWRLPDDPEPVIAASELMES